MQDTYYLNGHNFIEKELDREDVGFCKNDNAYLDVPPCRHCKQLQIALRPT
jgi:hypothetical protein